MTPYTAAHKHTNTKKPKIHLKIARVYRRRCRNVHARIIHQVGACASYIAVWTYRGSVERFWFRNLLWCAADAPRTCTNLDAPPSHVVAELSENFQQLGNGQTYATLGVPYYRASRIFMSRNFHPCNMVPHFHVPQVYVSHFQRPQSDPSAGLFWRELCE